VGLKVAKHLGRVWVTGDADDDVDVVGHDRDGEEAPTAVGGGLPELLPQCMGLVDRDADRRAAEAAAGGAVEAGQVGVVGRAGGVVFAARGERGRVSAPRVVGV